MASRAATFALALSFALSAPFARASNEGSAPAGAPWGLPGDLLTALSRVSERYGEYALRFTCLETVRSARYDAGGEASEESTRRYAFMLDRSAAGSPWREYRQRVREDGTPRGGEVRDEEPFPPAYAWVFLFSRGVQPYFAYRDLGDRFDGFDWVREIEFRGGLPFTDGKDIRQWEGTVLLDASTLTPLTIRASPRNQEARVRAIYDRWTQAFDLLGIKLAQRPFLYACQVQFRLRRDGLDFPTDLRYDTRRADGPNSSIPWRASSRSYQDYRFFKTSTTETPGRPAP